MPVFEADVLIDGVSDEPRYDAAVLVEDGRVAEVGSRGDFSAETRYEHDVLIPGLVDAHLHLAGTRSMDPLRWAVEDVATMTARATGDCRRLLAAGFTSVRDVGSVTGIGLRTAIDEGEIPGPRVHTSGRAISQTAGHGDAHMLPVSWVKEASPLSTLADGADECRKAARERIREGVDCLKIMTTGGVLSEKDSPEQSQFTDEEIRAMTEEAHRVGIPVASHAQGAAGIKSALRNGVDTIEHGFHMDDECIELFGETGATFVPTLAIMYQITEYGDDHGVPEWGLRKSRDAREHHYDAVRRAVDAGVPVALGTDFIGPDLVPHGENALEAELFVENVGMTEMDALQAGTSVAASALGNDDVGAIEPGRHADLVALADDPLRDIAALRAVEQVYKGGEPADV